MRSAACTPIDDCRCLSETWSPASRSAGRARQATSSDRTRTEAPSALRSGRIDLQPTLRQATATRPSFSGSTQARVAASRPVSRVLYRDSHRGDDHPSLAAGYPTAQAADPRTGQHDLFRSNARLPEPPNRVLLFGLAPGRVCRVSPSVLELPRARLRLCGTGPRLAADGRYPLPCAEELGLSSRHRLSPSARDRPADSPRRDCSPVSGASQPAIRFSAGGEDGR
jgi:hypothetical protein